MGVKGLWDIIGDGEITSLAEISSKHFEQTGRPFRVAVDEAGWRFSNLTEQQVVKIREQEPAANPIEKALFFRILKLQRLNIQLLLVFDGPGRPWKKGRRGGGKIDYERIKLWRELLHKLGVPAHQAPGEAEAECARLQQEGVVDAVWSEDSDTLMFGAQVLICNHRTGPQKKKSDTHVQIYRAESIQRDYGLGREGLVLFALLSGGDYDVKGLQGCGPERAYRAAKSGLGTILCNADPFEFRIALQEFFRPGKIDIPPLFPNPRILKNYQHPKVSTTDDLLNLRGLRRGWNLPIDHTTLLTFAQKYFNFTDEQYVTHVVPVLLTKILASTESSQKDMNKIYDIEIMPRKQKNKSKAMEQNGEVLDRKISYSPAKVVQFYIPGRRWEEECSLFEKNDVDYEQTRELTKCEQLECVLRNGLPESTFLEQKSDTKNHRGKRKSDTVIDTTAPKRARKKQKTNTKSSAPTPGSDNETDSQQDRADEAQRISHVETLAGSLSENNAALTTGPATVRLSSQAHDIVPPALGIRNVEMGSVTLGLSSASVEDSFSTIFPEQLTALLEMGYDLELSIDALDQAGGHIEEAIDYISAVESAFNLERGGDLPHSVLSTISSNSQSSGPERMHTKTSNNEYSNKSNTIEVIDLTES